MRQINENRFSEIEEYIIRYKNDYDRSPSMDEMTKALGIPKTTLHRYLNMMKERGMLDYDGRRNIRTVDEMYGSNNMELVLVGEDTSCGPPSPTEGKFTGYAKLPVSIFGRGNFFILTAKGDSMIDAGISSGDILVLRYSNTAEDGDIVLAYDPESDGITLKRLFKDRKHNEIVLHPENSSMSDIRLKEVMIQGILVSVIKRSENLFSTLPEDWDE